MTFRKHVSERSDPSLSVDEWANYLSSFSYQGVGYPFLQFQQTLVGNREQVGPGFASYVQSFYRANGPVFTCMMVRSLLFSEARFQFRRMNQGRPGELFGSYALDPLETPWSGGTTGDLLARAIQDVDLAGNFYGVRRGDWTVDKTGRFRTPAGVPGGPSIRRLQPDWVYIIIGSQSDPDMTRFNLDAELIGYVYQPGGPMSKEQPNFLNPEQVCHFAPYPDPLYSHQGMSWLTPIVREIMGDGAATTHKLKFFENGATPNMVVSFDPSVTEDAFKRMQQAIEAGHAGVRNAYRTLYFGGGASVQVVGSDLKQLDFKTTQGAGETRIAAAAGLPPVIAGFSEGLASATYSNYAQARRRLADGTLRPLWRNFAGSVQRIIAMPPAAQLWYDDRDIPFLKEDQQEEAQIRQAHATTISTLVSAGFTPETVVSAVIGGDFTALKHCGLYSVQLQPPGELGEPGGPSTVPALPAPNGAKNGSGNLPVTVPTAP